MKGVERTPKTHAYLNLGSPLNAISASHDGSNLIVAGRDTVKIVSLENDEQPKVVLNLRAGKTQSLNYTGNDCCWHPSQVDNYKYLISTAATNGAVVVWNITREGARSVEKVWTDHNRAVNKLAWHPEKSDYLLTGSQDTTLKLSDIRDATPCKITFQPKSEAVRDVQFHPFNSTQFAAAFDNGTVQLWDIRKNTQAVEKITAHQGLVLSIEWHPEEKNHIASGGRDRAIRVWDISTGKLLNNVSTISSVSRIKWRPGHKTQIASCSSIVDLQTHIWDIKRPYIPIASLTEHRDVPTGLIWRDSSTLISCSKDNYLLINDLNTDAYQPYKHIRTTGIGWNVQNELVSINDKINRNTNNESVPLSLQYPSFFASFNQVQQSPPSPPKTEKGVLVIHSPLGAGKIDKVVDPSFLFEYFAKNYRFKDSPFIELCEHNENVALRVHQYQISKLWSLMKLYFNEVEDTSKLGNNNIISNSNSSSNLNLNSIGSVNNNNSNNIGNNSNSSNSGINNNNNSGNSGANNINNSKIDNDGLTSIEGSDIGSKNPVFIDDQSSSASLGTSNGLLDDDDDDPIYNILSAEAVTPLAPLPTRAPSPTSKLDSMDMMRKKQHSFGNLRSELSDDNIQQHMILNSNSTISSSNSLVRDNEGILRSVSSTSLDILKSATEKRRYKQQQTFETDLFPELEIPQFDLLPTIIEILENCIEKGDVQTCVFTVLILQDKLKFDSLRISQWFGSYVELLHRFKMWNCANDIMKNCGDPSVGSMNQRSTSILVSCACGKTLPPNTTVCDKCGTIPAECSVCRLPVKGAFVWCQGCGHGGHLEHMKQWFESDHDVCPTGTCTHICKPRAIIA